MNYLSLSVFDELSAVSHYKPVRLAELQHKLCQMDPSDLLQQVEKLPMGRPHTRHLRAMIQYPASHHFNHAPFYFRSLCEAFGWAEPASGIAIEKDGTINLHHVTRFYEAGECPTILAQRILMHHPEWKSLAPYFGDTVLGIEHMFDVFYSFQEEYSVEQRWNQADNHQYQMNLPTIDGDIPLPIEYWQHYAISGILRDLPTASSSNWKHFEKAIATMTLDKQQRVWECLTPILRPEYSEHDRILNIICHNIPVQIMLHDQVLIEHLQEQWGNHIQSWIQQAKAVAAIDPLHALGTLDGHQESEIYLA